MKVYLVTYMGNNMGVFYTEEEANKHSDDFGGVYGVEELSVENLVQTYLEVSNR